MRKIAFESLVRTDVGYLALARKVGFKMRNAPKIARNPEQFRVLLDAAKKRKARFLRKTGERSYEWKT